MSVWDGLVCWDEARSASSRSCLVHARGPRTMSAVPCVFDPNYENVSFDHCVFYAHGGRLYRHQAVGVLDGNQRSSDMEKE